MFCRETGIQKWARMLMKTGKAFADPSATTNPFREDSESWGLPPLTILWLRTPLVTITHPEDELVKFDLEKLKDPKVLETFKAIPGGKSAPLTIMNNEGTDVDSLITTFNTSVTETASELFGKHRKKKEKKKLRHCRNSASMRQKERTEKEELNLKGLRNTRK